jgi:hypothetical protein
MKLEDLEAKLGISDLSEAEKLALVKDIQANLPALRAEQMKLESQTQAQMVIAAVKKIQENVENRFNELSGFIESKTASITSGKDGIQGPKGEQGDRGLDGAPGIQGPRGVDGKDGQDGEQGVGVADARVDFDGSLIITLTDGKEINAGEVLPFETTEKLKVYFNNPAVSGSSLPDQTGNSGKFLTTNGTDASWATVSSGSGTVTSVGLTAPTGLTVTGSPVTTSGTLALSMTAGYAIPTTASQANWDTAYGWGNHASAGYVVSGGALGTPSSGTLTNCTFPTLNQNTTGTASNVTGTVAIANGGTGATTLAGASIVTYTGTETLTNKDIVERVVAIADGTSITINADTTDIATQANTQTAGTLTINAPTGTPVNGQKIVLRLQSTNVQTFSWNAIFAGSVDLPLPTASTGSSDYDYLGFVYNSTASKWQLLAKVFGF